MDRLAKQIVQIANEIAEIEKNEEMEKTASINREAGFFTNLFNKGVTPTTSANVIEVIKDLQKDIDHTFGSLINGKMTEIKKRLEVLKKTKETNQFYDMFANWFQDTYKNLDKGVQTFFKTKTEADVIKMMKQWAQDGNEKHEKIAASLQKLQDKLNDALNSLIKKVKEAGVGIDENNDEDLDVLDSIINKAQISPLG